MILVEADVSEEWDSSVDWALLAKRAAWAAVNQSDLSDLMLSGLAAEISVRFTSDDEVKALNASWRGKDKATNVLSFPMADLPFLDSIARNEGGETLLGDIVLAQGVCAREAADKGIDIRAHAAHLLVHGTLHLLGYDHEQGGGEAEIMEGAERRALAAMGVADPYEIHG